MSYSWNEQRRRLARYVERVSNGRCYRWLAYLAFAGCLALCVSDVTLWFVLDGYSPVQETISDLAAGAHSWVADGGIVAFAFGILALAAGFTLHDDADKRSWIVRAALVVTAVCFLVLALWNEYGDASPGGLVIHPYVAAVLGVSVAIVFWVAPAPSQPDGLKSATRALAVIWIIGAGTLDLVPDAIQGLQERVLMILIVVAVAISAWRLMRLAPNRA